MKIPPFAIFFASAIGLSACCRNAIYSGNLAWVGQVGDAVAEFQKTTGRMPKDAAELNPFITNLNSTSNRHMPPLKSAYSHNAPDGVAWVHFETQPDPGECHGYEGTVGFVEK